MDGWLSKPCLRSSVRLRRFGPCLQPTFRRRKNRMNLWYQTGKAIIFTVTSSSIATNCQFKCDLIFPANRMKTSPKKFWRAVVVGALFLSWLAVTSSSGVDILNLGSTGPTPSGYDLAQLSTNGNVMFPPTGVQATGLNYYTDNNPPPGQT